ncbi:MAG TPA: protein kinase [Myxococcales bacterium]|nr:protein kinase [Myxococcales bacterium]
MTVQNPARGLRPFKPIPFGRYTLVAPIATGGMGEIFLARMEGPQGFEKFCVIKKILPHLAEDGEFVERFVNEAKTLVKLSHGSIAQVLDMGLHNGDPYIALEHVDGKDLRKVASRMREQGTPPPLTYVLYVMSRVLDALAYAHRKRDEDDREIGLVHRDISPQNVLVSYEGEVKVIDFGLAKSSLSSAKTNPSIILGKFMYMSPEQARHQPADRRSDLYSVALCLYELIAGKNPFDDAPTGELMQRVANPQISSLLGVDPLLPPQVAQVVQKGLAVDPDTRYQTAEEFRGRLMACLLEIDPSAGPESVSRFMRDTFSGEFAAERRMLQALKESSRPPPGAYAPGGHLETGIVNLGTTLQPPSSLATPAAAMPSYPRRASPLVQSGAQSRWRDNRDQVTEVATEHDVPVLNVAGYPGLTPQQPSLSRSGGMEPTMPRAAQPGMVASPLSTSASEPTRRASLPEPPGSLSNADRSRRPLLRSREEITDPTRVNFSAEASDDIPEVSPDAVVDLLSEREATIRSAIPAAPDHAPIRVGLAVTLDDPLGQQPSQPSAPRAPALGMTLDDLRGPGPPGPPKLGLGSTQDIPPPVFLDKYKSGAVQRLKVSGPKISEEPPPVEDLGSTQDLPGVAAPLRSSEPTDRIPRKDAGDGPRLMRLAVVGIVVGVLAVGGYVAFTAWKSGAFGGGKSQGTPLSTGPEPVKLPANPEATAPAPPAQGSGTAAAGTPEPGGEVQPASSPASPGGAKDEGKDGKDPKDGKDDSISLGPLRPAQEAVVVRHPPKHKLPKNSPLFREWNRTAAAFEDLSRVKSCDQPSMGVICHRFEDLKRDIEAADSDTPIDSLITRVRYMSESIAAKKVQVH